MWEWALTPALISHVTSNVSFLSGEPSLNPADLEKKKGHRDARFHSQLRLSCCRWEEKIPGHREGSGIRQMSKWAAKLFLVFFKLCLSLPRRTYVPQSGKRKSHMDAAERIHTDSSCSSVFADWHGEQCQTNAAVQTLRWRAAWITHPVDARLRVTAFARLAAAARVTQDTHDSTWETLGIWASQEVAVTHLPHVFVAVVPEVQLVICYDFVASAVVVVWICAEKPIRYINKSCFRVVPLATGRALLCQCV